jgi:hypothetical protein
MRVNSSGILRWHIFVMLPVFLCILKSQSYTTYNTGYDRLHVWAKLSHRLAFIRNIKKILKLHYVWDIHLYSFKIQWGMLQQTVFINKIRMLQQTQMLQWTRRNTIGQCSTHVHMMCWAFPLWLEYQSSSLVPFVRFSYQFSSVICLLAPLAVNIFFFNYSAISF